MDFSTLFWPMVVVGAPLYGLAFGALLRHGRYKTLLGFQILVTLGLLGWVGTRREIPAPLVATAELITAEIATDAELTAIAAAEPKIDLDSEEAADDSAGAGGARNDRPAWTNGDVAENQTVLTAGPFTTPESCVEATPRLIAEWMGLPEEAAGALPADELIQEQYAETRETSVGEVHLLHTLVERTPELEAKVEQLLAVTEVRQRRTQSVRAVSFAGAGVLSLVAAAHIVLRAGGRQPKSNTP